jgi:predicted DNA-binding protein (UPF0251 family)
MVEVAADRKCLDCGKDVVTGIRCRNCNGAYTRRVTALQMEEEDRKLIALIESEGLTSERLGARLGVSRQAADNHIKGARKRLAILEAAK